ncbi:unnamed protein product [Cuscuta epithymum]|uniref:Leucine-rich repeat-containing N-terminal plant-type domain-containing protein n=1 Tax=Cuscuta epithymum TaxID=186058 RepID=A0AAV0DVU3_9ASTE|nr:unnamed protein product [Cuscuta epithymum]
MMTSISITAICYFLVIHIFILRKGVVADLKADKEALLEFASAVGGGEKLGWSREAQICSDWAGVKCRGSRVVELHLPGMGLSGGIPENTIERLDALRALSLDNNSFTGSLPWKLMKLKSLNESNNSFEGSIPASLSRFPHPSFAGNALLMNNQPCRPRRLLMSKKKKDKLVKLVIGCIFTAIFICGVVLAIRCYHRHKAGKDIIGKLC